MATSLCRQSEIADGSGELRTAAAAFVTAIIDKVDEILAGENGNFPAELARRMHKLIASFGCGPPDLDQGYFCFGLLDCISQLGALSEMLGERLSCRLKNLIFSSVAPEFRWKAVSAPGLRDEAPPSRNQSLCTNTSHSSKSFCPVTALAPNSIKRWKGTSEEESPQRPRQMSWKRCGSSKRNWIVTKTRV